MSLENNPLIKNSPHKHGAFPFEEIKQEHFLPAFEFAIKDVPPTVTPTHAAIIIK